MGSVTITHREYKHLTEVYNHAPASFFEHQLVFAKVYREAHDDELPTTIFWRYLEERRGLDPARFDHFHPIVGRWIGDQPQLITPPPPVQTPPPGHVEPPPSGGGGAPGHGGVPEPASWVLLMIATSLLLLWARAPRRRRVRMCAIHRLTADSGTATEIAPSLIRR